MKLDFENSKIVHLNKYPGVEGTTHVLKVRSLLTRTLAEQLRCRDLCFCESGVPRRFGEATLAETIENCEVHLDFNGAGGTWLASEVSHMSVGKPKDASDTDPSLEIRYNLHFDGAVPLNAWVDGVNKGEFRLSVTPPADWHAQGELAFEADDNADDAEDDDEQDEDEPPAGDAEPAAGEQEPIENHLRGDVLEEHRQKAGPTLSPAPGGTPHVRRGRRRQIPDPKVN